MGNWRGEGGGGRGIASAGPNRKLQICTAYIYNTVYCIYVHQRGTGRTAFYAKLLNWWRGDSKRITQRLCIHTYRHSVADPDPGSGAFWPLDPESGLGKKSRAGSGMNIPDYNSESLNNFLGVDVDPESFWPWIRDGKIRIPDPG